MTTLVGRIESLTVLGDRVLTQIKSLTPEELRENAEMVKDLISDTMIDPRMINVVAELSYLRIRADVLYKIHADLESIRGML